MAEPKTRVNDASVDNFIDAIPDEQIREDSKIILGIMRDATKAEPRMWGTNIVGFGEYRQVYANGKEAEWMLTAFSPRKQKLTLYIMDGVARHGELMSKLGTHSCGKSCLHIKRLSDVHLPTLRKLVETSVVNKLKAG